MTSTPWGPLGYITFKRTYARRLNDLDENSKTEEYLDTVERIIKACRDQLNCGFTAQEESEVRGILLNLKGSVAGRFLWQLGTTTVGKLGLLSLQNCAATVVDSPRAFTWAMDALMLGSGVGFNIQREYVYQLPKVKSATVVRQDTYDADFIVPDSRQGWVKLLEETLRAHFETGVGFSYSTAVVRGKGAPIKGFGGTASGPEILCTGIAEINRILNSRADKQLRPIDALDIMNVIGSIVVAGNVRRSAEIAIGDADDLQYLSSKRWDLGNIPNYRAMSNNSVVCNDITKLPEQFWEGYKGNGEPFGLINLRLSRQVGRLGETQYPDPNVKIYNPCFTGETTLLTADGYKTFSELNNTTFKVINHKGESHTGKVWSNGVKSIVMVRNSAGETIRCTPDHVFMLNDGSEIVAANLKGKRLMPLIQVRKTNDHFTKLGFIQGDGGLGRLNSSAHKGLEIHIGHKDQEIGMLFGVDYSAEKRAYYVSGFNDELKELGFNSNSLPERTLPTSFNTWSDSQKLSFLRGMYSANGCVIAGRRVSFKTTCSELALELKDVLSQYNIQSYITTNKPKSVSFSNGDYTCRQSYDLNITQYDSVRAFAKLIGFVHEYKSNALKDLLITNSPVIMSVKEAGEAEVFDFNIQDDTHWGVVGSGYIAHNCAEQPLEPYETCCLAEIFLPNITSKEELVKVAKYLYRINKHSLTLPCHLKETESIVHRNMRMGIGVTGYLQATEEQRSWLSGTYLELREYDKQYSKEKGFPTSIKLTTVKPSGTLSLLAGVTSGVHPAYSQYFIRRIRISSSSSLANLCRKHGYFSEYQRNFDGTEDKNTVVVSFPVAVPAGTVLAKDVTAIQQLEYVKRLQTEWSDNAVSCTVYYRREELDSIREWLNKNYNDGIKSVSFLLHSDHGFQQAPLEEITKEEYEAYASMTTPIQSGDVSEDDLLDSFECVGGVCPIK